MSLDLSNHPPNLFGHQPLSTYYLQINGFYSATVNLHNSNFVDEGWQGNWFDPDLFTSNHHAGASLECVYYTHTVQRTVLNIGDNLPLAFFPFTMRHCRGSKTQVNMRITYSKSNNKIMCQEMNMIRQNKRMSN